MGSPSAAREGGLSTFHRAQHFLLRSVAPPLILLGAPALPLLYGVPRRFMLHVAVVRLLRSVSARALGRVLAQPAVCWSVAIGVLIGWHAPPLFQLGLGSEGWHGTDHASLLASGRLVG